MDLWIHNKSFFRNIPSIFHFPPVPFAGFSIFHFGALSQRINILLIGSGGREHALAYKIKESSLIKNLYILPGNPGTKKLGENISLDINDPEKLLSFCKEKEVELIIIGPEKPLVEGLGDFFRKNGIKVFGPDSKAAEIEAHKSFAKNFMRKYKIPTADYVEFESKEYAKAKKFLETAEYPVVIKADGLAAGKGVIICYDVRNALKTLDEIFIKKIFGAAGDKIVVEEFLEGEEASILAVTDGKEFICLPSAQDHKRIGNNDTGKNTGGMGAYSPAPVVTPKILKEVEEKIIIPTLKGLGKEGRTFSGCLYCGLMITKKGVKVVEFNCRFGDPETQAVLPVIKGDFLKLIYSAADGKLDKSSVKYSGGSAVCIVAASKGYPDEYSTGYEIDGLDEFNNNKEILVFHAGTKEKDGKVITSGGRVLGITSVFDQNNLKEAQKNAYDALKKINFKDIYYRTDIASRALK
ncbi:MAG TPA: phosphoribosylamine--glycine ligase [Ignavibacteriaceae bacterium]|nr:phosphoribosylamine--glycine ligase [Ignavibacteriaceae bacterium]